MKVGGEEVRKWEGGHKAMERVRNGRGQKGGEHVGKQDGIYQNEHARTNLTSILTIIVGDWDSERF